MRLCLPARLCHNPLMCPRRWPQGWCREDGEHGIAGAQLGWVRCLGNSFAWSSLVLFLTGQGGVSRSQDFPEFPECPGELVGASSLQLCETICVTRTNKPPPIECPLLASSPLPQICFSPRHSEWQQSNCMLTGSNDMFVFSRNQPESVKCRHPKP